jgi:hypothetical protein
LRKKEKKDAPPKKSKWVKTTKVMRMKKFNSLLRVKNLKVKAKENLLTEK